jgi:hypothetical protein
MVNKILITFAGVLSGIFIAKKLQIIKNNPKLKSNKILKYSNLFEVGENITYGCDGLIYRDVIVKIKPGRDNLYFTYVLRSGVSLVYYKNRLLNVIKEIN